MAIFSVFKKKELSSVICIASIYGFRMLGLFVVLPILPLYVDRLYYANSFLIGIAVGIYGLAQALLQLFWGILSDLYNRKIIILIGIIIFILGSFIAASSNNIYMVIIGRGLQGSGAIGSVLMALLFDITSRENYLKSMSIIGLTIGIIFIFSLILSPILDYYFRLSGIFFMTACLGLISIIVLSCCPHEEYKKKQSGVSKKLIKSIKNILYNFNCIKSILSVFLLHAIFTSFFLIIPNILKHIFFISLEKNSFFYLITLMISIFLITPILIFLKKNKVIYNFFVLFILLLIFTQILFVFFYTLFFMFFFLIILFFSAFMFLEATLPTLIAKESKSEGRGTIMGIYSSMQFLGIFLGGFLGGLVIEYSDIINIFYLNIIFGFVWILIILLKFQKKHLNMS